MNEFLEQFLIEGRELVEQGVRDLLELEQSPDDRQRLDGAFRAFHTLKGAAGIVDFDAMGRALHAAEDALAAVRSGERAISANLITQALSCLDSVAAWLRIIEATDDLPVDAAAEADRIIAMFAHSVQAVASPTLVGVTSDLEKARQLIEAQIALVGEGGEGRIGSALRVSSNVMRRLGRNDQADQLEALCGNVSAGEAEARLRALLERFDAESVSSRGGASDRDENALRTLRIDVTRIDALVKLAGELTTAKNAIGHVARLAEDGADAATVASLLRERHATLERLVNDLQRSVLNVRVLPMGQVFQRFPRLVREMSSESGKPARLLSEGEDTEADKAIVEALFEPLLHVVRNALDHGVETAEVRERRGKPNVAKIILRAFRLGEHVVVEVEDDGGGIDVARVRESALFRGVASREEVEAMSDDEAAALIFTPGFSTAQAVTTLSGRGVGMDAVRSAIIGLGGQVELDNRAPSGTIIRFLLPFTLMMTRVMSVSAGGQIFGIPFDAVIETVRTPRAAISAIGAAHAFVYRDLTTPVIDLAQMLGRSLSQPERPEATLVVTSVAGELSAFEVDDVREALDVMLSPLDGLLAGLPGIAGATLLGDGQVLIVLDLHDLAG